MTICVMMEQLLVSFTYLLFEFGRPRIGLHIGDEAVTYSTSSTLHLSFILIRSFSWSQVGLRKNEWFEALKFSKLCAFLH